MWHLYSIIFNIFTLIHVYSTISSSQMSPHHFAKVSLKWKSFYQSYGPPKGLFVCYVGLSVLVPWTFSLYSRYLHSCLHLAHLSNLLQKFSFVLAPWTFVTYFRDSHSWRHLAPLGWFNIRRMHPPLENSPKGKWLHYYIILLFTF